MHLCTPSHRPAGIRIGWLSCFDKGNRRTGLVAYIPWMAVVVQDCGNRIRDQYMDPGPDPERDHPLDPSDCGYIRRHPGGFGGYHIRNQMDLSDPAERIYRGRDAPDPQRDHSHNSFSCSLDPSAQPYQYLLCRPDHMDCRMRLPGTVCLKSDR